MSKPNDWFKCGNDVHASIRKAERERVLAEVEAYLDGWHNDATRDPKWQQLCEGLEKP